MPFLRKKYTGDFTTISNHILKNKELSFKAKGLLVYMWSLPDNWNFHETELTNRATDGLASVRSGLKELEKYGYLVRGKRKRIDGQLTSETDWIISDTPLNVNIDEFSPICDFPIYENLKYEKPIYENHTLINTNTNKDSLLINTNNNKSKPAELAESLPLLLVNQEKKKKRN